MARRGAAATLALVCLGTALGSCVVPREERTPDGRIVLKYWEKWTGFEGEAMRDIVADYNAQSDEYFVEYIEGGALMDQKLLMAIAGGNPPDVAGFWSDRMVGFVQNGALEPLDNLMAEAGIGRDNYLTRVLDTCRYEGFTWGLPLTPATLALFYNREHFREAGLDPDRPPRTIQELDEFAERLTVWEDGEIVQLGFSPDIPGWWNNLWPIWFGGDMWDGEGTVTVDSRANIEAFEWVESYADRYTVDQLDVFKAASQNFDSPHWPFFSGRLSMTLQGTWMTNFLGRHAPEIDWGVAPFPAVDEEMNPVSFMQTDMIVIPRGSPHPEGAWDFIQFTQRQENLERLNIIHHKFSPLADVSEQFYAEHSNPEIDLFRDLANAPGTYTIPPLAAFNEMQAELWQVFYGVLKADRDPAAMLSAARDVMQRQLDRSQTRWERVRDERVEQWREL